MRRQDGRRVFWSTVFLLATLLTTGCLGAHEATDIDEHPTHSFPPDDGRPPNPPTPPNGHGAPQIGATCRSDDPMKICLAVKYVAYTNPNGNPIVEQEEAIENIDQINNIWDQCNLGFQIDKWVTPDPTVYGLRYNTNTQSSLMTVRGTFSEPDSLLVVTTGAWSRPPMTANAWTTLPGSTPYGAVLEGPVGTFAPIIAHELGHYLNLGHYSNSSNVMNPVIGSGSVRLTSNQCSDARSVAKSFWRKMLR